MKSELSLKGKFNLTAYFFVLKVFVNRLRQKGKTMAETEKQPYPNQERLYSIDTFDFSHTKWGWIYTYNSLTNNYFVQDVLPFCLRCDVPMQYDGNPFIDAICPACKQQNRSYHYPILQSKPKILAEIKKRYLADNYIDSVPENSPENQYILPDIPRYNHYT